LYLLQYPLHLLREREREGREREREEASEEWAAVIDEMFESCSIRHN
jgi:hypothetical protein